MDKELVVLDKLTDVPSRIDKNDLVELNWYNLLLYSLKSKTICIIYNSLILNDCLQYIPAKIYKIMSALYIGNLKQYQKLKSEIEKITTMLNKEGIKIYKHKNLYISRDCESLLMPNDIDFIAYDSNKQDIHRNLTRLDYKIKYLNNVNPNTQNFYTSNSVFYEKINIKSYEYPLKVDITYSFKSFKYLDKLLCEYEKQDSKEIKNILLFIINIIDFFEHINGNKENITIDDLFKIKRLQIQHSYIDSNLIKVFVKKYNIELIYCFVKDIFMNYLSIY